MSMRLQKISQGRQLRVTFCPRLLLLCLFFVAGSIIGFLAQKTVGVESNAELCEYLHRYADATAQGSLTPVSFFRVVAVYFRYPLLAFCLGFCSLGVFLLPLLCAIQGFFLSFSVCCFASALGRSGVYLAFVAFGLRVLLTLPCMMALSRQALENACRLHGSLQQRSGRIRAFPDAAYIKLLGICSAVLLLGTVLEITWLPHLFRWVIEKSA